MMAGSRVPKLEVPNFVKNQKWDLNSVTGFLVKPKLASAPGLLCCSRTDPSSLARELQLFCRKGQKLSHIESKFSLLTNCKQ
jgi:hypothetical protein